MSDSGDRSPWAQVRDAVADQPHLFRFFQAVRLLERLYPERSPVGGFEPPDTEAVRFSVNPSIAFPPSELERLHLPDGASKADQVRMTVNFMGLIGPQGQLPQYYTLLVADQLKAKRPALRDFLDIFQHRILSLLFRAWEKTRFYVTYERELESPLNHHGLDLLGLGLDRRPGALDVGEDALLFHAGLIAAGPRSALGLERLLESYFQVPVEIEQFVGGWYTLPEGDQCGLGDESRTSTRLGLGAVAGDEVWDPQARIRVRLGPMSRARYEDFLPTGSAYEPLAQLVRFYTHDAFDADVQLVLEAEDVPGLVVGDDEVDAPALGWATWIRTRDRDREGDEAVLAL